MVELLENERSLSTTNNNAAILFFLDKSSYVYLESGFMLFFPSRHSKIDSDLDFSVFHAYI